MEYDVDLLERVFGITAVVEAVISHEVEPDWGSRYRGS
jgi:hypothetical protein